MAKVRGSSFKPLTVFSCATCKVEANFASVPVLAPLAIARKLVVSPHAWRGLSEEGSNARRAFPLSHEDTLEHFEFRVEQPRRDVVDANASDDALRRIAPNHPVFRIEPQRA